MPPTRTDDSVPTTNSLRDSLVNRVQQRVVNNLNQRKSRVSQTVDGVVETVRRMSEPLRDQPYPALANAAEVTVDRMEAFATALRERDVQEVPEELRHFARRNPSVYLGVGLAAGLLAGRFLKSSAQGADAAPVAESASRPASLAADARQTSRSRRTPSSARTSASSAGGAIHGKEQK